jgi:hypothetical protein
MSGRKQRNARRVFDTSISFMEICKRARISPKQRILIRRYMIDSFKKGGEDK